MVGYHAPIPAMVSISTPAPEDDPTMTLDTLHDAIMLRAPSVDPIMAPAPSTDPIPPDLTPLMDPITAPTPTPDPTSDPMPAAHPTTTPAASHTTITDLDDDGSIWGGGADADDQGTSKKVDTAEAENQETCKLNLSSQATWNSVIDLEIGCDASMGTKIDPKVTGDAPLGSVIGSVCERGGSKFEGRQKVRHDDLLSNFSKLTGLNPSGTFGINSPIIKYGARKQLTR